MSKAAKKSAEEGDPLRFSKGDMAHPLQEESSFATLFPKYREKYLRDVWPEVTRALKSLGVLCELDLTEGSMTVRTTSHTWDPSSILKSRDVLKLLSRGVPSQQALKVLDDDVFCDVIKISGFMRSRERFVKRRQRLVGPNGATLKAIELLTGCYVLVQGKTVSAMGPVKGLEQVRKIVVDCMNNVHPVYNIKTLMIKRELAKDPKLAGENWERFLPKFKRKAAPKKPLKKKKEKKQYNPFPPAQPQSKVDKEIETGEYFLKKEQKRKEAQERKEVQQKEKSEERKREAEKSFVPPKEAKAAPQRKEGQQQQESIADLKEKLIREHRKRDRFKDLTSGPASEYLAPSAKRQRQTRSDAQREEQEH